MPTVGVKVTPTIDIKSINIFHQIWYRDAWKIASLRLRLIAQKSDFQKIQDGVRPPSWISILGHILASINIFEPNLVQ